MHRTRAEANAFYKQTLAKAEAEGTVNEVMNELGRRDLFFLLTKLLHRRDADRDWLYDRCRDVQYRPNGMLDLWAREHYKSTIITFAKSIQDILDSHSEESLLGWQQEVTIGILSHTRPIAKAFLSQIKMEFESNDLLKEVYPDVLYENPRRDAPKWSTDNGIIVKRKSNPKESTVEAWGLVDGQPTSKHFLILNYDDTVTRESVTTPDQIKKTTDAWELSTDLGVSSAAGDQLSVERYIGTRYHYNDTYRTILERKAAVPRIHAATDDGTAKGKPVFLSPVVLAEKRKKQGPYIFACQQLQDPKAEDAMGFKEEWIRYYDAHRYQRGLEPWPYTWNYYLLCDPAGERKKENDYTVMVILGLGPDENIYLVNGVRDRLNLVERTKLMFQWQRKYDLSGTGYEKYGKDSDIEHIEWVQEQDNYRFDITPIGGPMPKNDRIRRLVPVFYGKRFRLPYELHYIDYEGKTQDFVKQFIDDELLPFPVAVHDDMLDCVSRIEDPMFPTEYPQSVLPVDPTAAANNNYDPLAYR